ncbi:uncharacterized protein PADG_08707 [Paracoccidioides brasiliensis Pb18]|uniref:Uncharacterized protein n=1 Tax=Paracoccidioides brasiliensis (strain Pb18) TaxID=502780 RepID=C1GN71_PARBD|nr:uncharacterized protein PADG_08707 [Paracoccidioides brasiliensis Pb18]EEH46273.2 hypothetical protein PADG_08707 [Paracoccidioides brasiliensis Pb18]
MQPCRPIQRSFPTRAHRLVFRNTLYTQSAEKNEPAYDRSKVNPTSAENTKSGTYDDIAGHTSPESELEEVRQNAPENKDDVDGKVKSGRNPLEVSPQSKILMWEGWGKFEGPGQGV